VNFESFKYQFLVSSRPLSQNFTAGLAFSRLKSRLSRNFHEAGNLAKNLGDWLSRWFRAVANPRKGCQTAIW